MTSLDRSAAELIVVKVGSSSISGERRAQIEPLVDGLASLHRHSRVVLVSSGAISTGMPFLGLDERPVDLPMQQAAAAVGQNVLMNRYQRSLSRHEVTAAQILLTASDMDMDSHRVNARNALRRLLELRMLPIINENDTVATHEIRFGDNDRLAALVARLMGADRLILLSDIAALRTAPPDEAGSEPISTVPYGDPLEGVRLGASGSHIGSGGAMTKVDAARLAADAGVRVTVTATPLLERLVAGERLGTEFEPNPQPVREPDEG
ncbi:glutamate 5-kinase [Agrococcus sp. ARC_14]|uniref:glutamate 5-kinase n=1 Tax=Agrococcus sp. ARC_14 TaxID=2919927 RepID=UPI001F06B8C2|nr:glutamate 5-kinase [Agrococcus sp. ARC_14]MCH1883394.1 glutamate 5-kinase [Agrococcus sp. ARC_14]